MGIEVVRLGAWCDMETVEEYRDRLLAGADAADDQPEDAGSGGEPQPALFVPGPDWPSAEERDALGLSFRVEEFAVLADGRRLRLHADRGFGLGGLAGVDPWQHVTLESLESDVRATVLPDDAEETGEEHPWEWLSDLLRTQGIDAAAEELRGLPYDVEFSERLRARVTGGA
ncbi:hypothetical protein E4P41_09740 [Geodermatophilus sp. DF01-2]|uniref:hypothetical protein n=1 Tax=Geodermatophilus sp. DF01-2 TaxID=2559610 RepID=UPI001072F32B|nr:hypothetical protein [Geodermatophilus sp. DF01_2]TFV61292.1 hypothetical protein E4P41_09740 [Geodermatophilus sp. DF01_2]